MDWPQLLALPLRLGFLLAGLLVPGELLLRALGLPLSLSGSFIISAVMLHGIVLLLAFTGLPINAASLGFGVGFVILAACYFSRRATAPAPDGEGGIGGMFSRWNAWTPLYAAVWLVLLYRQGAQPLTGPDIGFRWSWLAEQVLRQGSLDFYPPHSAGDFAKYFWAESIPPGVASLYAWSYACGGGFAALWTSPVVLLQFLALHDLVWRLAHRHGGEPAARLAVLLLAATPLLTWSVVIGQETGLTAIGVCGLVYSLGAWAAGKERGWLVLAGASAALVAGAREYGVCFAAVGGAVLLLWRVPVRPLLAYAAWALALPLLWFGFVWLKTGNPVYSLNVAGLFPVNDTFDRYTAFVRLLQTAGLATPDGLFQLARYLLLFALPACAGLAFAAWKPRLDFVLIAIFLAATAALWLMSVSYTAGGLFYSLRVLSPAFALAAVLGGAVAAGWAGNARFEAVGTVLLLGVVLESLPKTLALPVNPYRSAPVDWWTAGGEFVGRTSRAEAELRDYLRARPRGSLIITESAGLQRALAETGLRVTPIWSPENSWMFDRASPGDSPPGRASTETALLILTRDSHGARFVQAASVLADGKNLQPAHVTDNFAVYHLRAATTP